MGFYEIITAYWATICKLLQAVRLLERIGHAIFLQI